MLSKKKLEARKAKLEKKRDELIKRSEDSHDVEEVRAIGDRLRDIVEDLRDVEDDLLAIAEEEAGERKPDEGGEDGGEDGRRSAGVGNFRALGTYGANKAESRTIDDPTSTLEYRKAFRAFVASGKPIPSELRADANTTTGDVSSVIPTVIMNRIIEGLTVCGMILAEVTKTAFPAGVVVPTSSVKPVATWVAEGAGSDRQKKTTGKVTFSYYKLRCEISMSAEVEAMAISAFEDAFVANVVDAMVVAIEKATIAGGGADDGCPTGILTQTVPTGQTITIADTTTHIPTYAELVEAEAALPVEYENTAKWFMTKKQFMAFVGMVDDNGQPIARVDYGIEERPTRRLLGREVVVHPYATEMGDIIAAIYDFRDYVINTVYDLGIQRKQDWETEDYLTKAVMSVDGKPVSAASLVVMK